MGSSIRTPCSETAGIGVQCTMRRTAWIWLAGCLAWTLDCGVNLVYGNRAHAELALTLAVLFGIAYGFYRNQPR